MYKNVCFNIFVMEKRDHWLGSRWMNCWAFRSWNLSKLLKRTMCRLNIFCMLSQNALHPDHCTAHTLTSFLSLRGDYLFLTLKSKIIVQSFYLLVLLHFFLNFLKHLFHFSFFGNNTYKPLTLSYVSAIVGCLSPLLE